MIPSFLKKKHKRLPKDEFIDRILYSVAGMTIRSNIYLMDKGIAAMPQNSDILEIGSFAGQSAILMHYLMKKHNKKGRVLCVDPYVYEGWFDNQRKNDNKYIQSVGGQLNLNRTNYLNFIHESFVKNTLYFCPENTPLLFKMSSHDFFEKIKKNEIPELSNLKIGFCYIDGDHSKEAALADMKNCINTSLPNAYILMDDTDAAMKLGSVEAVKEIKKLPTIKIVQSNPNILFQKTH